MTPTNAVTATANGDSRSLKVTIPAELARKFDIRPGDAFWIETEEGDALVLKYVRTGRSDGSTPTL